MGDNDWHAASVLLHDDFVLSWPQSGERSRGRAHFIAVNEHYPAHGRGHFELKRLIAGADQVASEVDVTDGVQHGRAITFSQVRDDKIAAQTEYWPERFDAASWRARWVERYQPEIYL